MSLKKQIKDLQKALGEKDSEAASLRRHIKMTSLEEIKVELQIYVAECQRLRSLLDELMNNQRDAVELDNIAIRELAPTSCLLFAVDEHIAVLNQDFGMSARHGNSYQLQKLIKP